MATPTVNPNQQYQILADTHSRGADSAQRETSKAPDPAVEARRARRWALATLVAHVVFTLSWLLAAAWQGPRYNVFERFIALLGAAGIVAIAVGVLRIQRQRTTVPRPDALTE